MAEILKNDWFYEYFTGNAKFGIKIKDHFIDTRSEFQKIDFYDSYEYGRFFTLDGFIMLTERDEFIYHEMLVHLPMAVNADAKNVLIIGGGDGGAVRELVRYPGVRHIDMVEIDKDVVDACRDYLPSVACKLDDPRVHITYEDGLRFVRRKEDEYDLIIVDSTDPFGPGEGLFTKEFYGNCYKALTANGILVNQHESPFYPDDARAMQRAHYRIRECFPLSRVYQAHIPTYPSGHWLFGFASKKYHPLKDLRETQWNMRGLDCRYYTTTLHKGAFYIPAYVEELLKRVEQEY